jgi:threonine dehydratase
VPRDEMEQWRTFLGSLGYQYWDESQNPAYQLFLG